MKAVWPFASLSIFLQEFWLAQRFSRCLLFRANSFDRRSKALWLYFKTRSAWIEMDSAVLNWYSGEENHWPIISRRQLKSCLGKYWLGLYRQFGLARISRLPFSRRVRTIHTISNTFEFASNRLFWTLTFLWEMNFTVSKETEGAFSLAHSVTQGPNLASFVGFQSPFQHQWIFVSFLGGTHL